MVLAVLPACIGGAASSASDLTAISRSLRAAYPELPAHVDGDVLVWNDGARMPLDDGQAEKSISDWLRAPDIKDMFRQAYPAGAPLAAPPADFDPGRARNGAFFVRMYGDCTSGAVARNLVDVAWLPRRSKLKLKVTRINGVAGKLAAVSTELDKLPKSYDRFLLPPAGTYNCRTVAGTTQASAHAYGIAIDLAVGHAHYWRWSKPDAAGRPVWRNQMPVEIVRIFERHGFIWGGRWSHYDTMHFEYRPELLLPKAD